MSRALQKRLEKLEGVLIPSPLVNVRLVAEDDPEAAALIAASEEWRPGDPAPTLIVMVAGRRNAEGVVP